MGDDLIPVEPWAQQGSEPDFEYAWFRAFVELGDHRTPEAAARRVGVPVKTVRAAAKQHRWAERAAAYDATVRKLSETLAADETEALAMQYAAGVMMLRLGVTAVQLKNPSLLKMKDVKDLMQQGAEMARRGAGVADLNVGIDVRSRVESMFEDLLGE